VGSFNSMGYKVLGYMVWQGSKWYFRHKVPGSAPKLGIAGVALAGGALVVQRRVAR
jgi:hypothetical protein